MAYKYDEWVNCPQCNKIARKTEFYTGDGKMRHGKQYCKPITPAPNVAALLDDEQVSSINLTPFELDDFKEAIFGEPDKKVEHPIDEVEINIHKLKDLLEEMENAFYGGYRPSINEENIDVMKWVMEKLERGE